MIHSYVSLVLLEVFRTFAGGPWQQEVDAICSSLNPAMRPYRLQTDWYQAVLSAINLCVADIEITEASITLHVSPTQH